MKILLTVLGLLLAIQLCLSQTKQSCHSPVYCQGDLLHVIQTAGIFNDSKTFVDMAMINSINDTMMNFHTMMAETDNNPSKEQIQKFLKINFKSIGELDEIQPRDFKPEPKIIKEISDPVVRKFAKRIISIWPSLTRQVSQHVHTHPETHSLIPVTHPFVIPGGRFKEYYYWDSYWILKGLLLSDMLETAKGMLQNLLSVVDRYGFVPNGGRIYYLNRSQPPLLSLMVGDYARWTKDYEFLRASMPTLNKELHFWIKNRLIDITKNGIVYKLAHYDSESDTPRPESYLEDIETCSYHKEDDKMYECFTDLKSGAESGWDFTSRWIFEKRGEPSGDLRHINTRRNIPVDLNAFLFKAFKAMYKFCLILEKEEDAKYWKEWMDNWREGIEAILYHPEDGTCCYLFCGFDPRPNLSIYICQILTVLKLKFSFINHYHKSLGTSSVHIMNLLLGIVGLLAVLQLAVADKDRLCHNPILCNKEILRVIQTAKIFNDSKIFVDMTMINSVNETSEQFFSMMSKSGGKPSKESVIEFVNNNFKMTDELQVHFPVDFKPEPKIVKEISNPVVRNFTKDVISIWPDLTRRISPEVLTHPDGHTIIPVQKPFIVPGGRFREFYYWDSYWIVKGLLLSDMVETAKGIIENLLFIVEQFGYVPNGGRFYYLTRSQPPLLTLMVDDYFNYTKDIAFLRQNIGTLNKELFFWLTARVIEIQKGGKTYLLAHYDSRGSEPRPESYLEDIETCLSYEDLDEKEECYTDLQSGAESGWDFTSRWIFDQRGDISGDLKYIGTRRIVPVDLNSFLYKAFRTMYRLNLVLNREEDAKYWLDKTENWKEAMENVLYHQEDGIWYDYDLKLGKHRRYYFASNLTPLWAGAMDDSVKSERGGKAVEYLKKRGIINYHGGIPSSLFPTGQQWDFPNAWSPYQNLVIIGLDKSGNEDAKELAQRLAHSWVNANIRGFHDNKVMFEKYHAQYSGQFGGGGEYQIQSGFGWSNGCVLELIHLYYRAKTRKYKGPFQ